jgi:SAM-dependent methyltransferase
MIRCQACQSVSPFNGSGAACEACGWTPTTVDGFAAYAPNFASGGGGFEASFFNELARLEANNFWFRSRNQLLLWVLKRYHPDLENFLEIGCGTGFVLSGIASAFPDTDLYGSEIFTAGLDFASHRTPSASLMQMDARAVPFVNQFDVIGAFDVLEHIKEDELVLTQMRAALRAEGTLIITVPQHPSLWSTLDDYSHHFRRYTEKELRQKVERAGFKILKNTSFVTLLLPAMMASRFLRKNKPVAEIDIRAELSLSPVVNWIFGRVMSLERSIITTGINMPFGGSRLLVAKKK